MNLVELKKMKINELTALGRDFAIEGASGMPKQDLIFSETLHRSVKDAVQCRLLDSVAVKGREKGVKIYTSRRRLTQAEMDGWGMHNLGMGEYYERNFGQAISYFKKALKAMPGDHVATLLLERSQRYRASPPPAGWDGVEVMTRK